MILDGGGKKKRMPGVPNEENLDSVGRSTSWRGAGLMKRNGSSQVVVWPYQPDKDGLNFSENSR